MKSFHKSSLVVLLLTVLGLGGVVFLGRQLQTDANQIIDSYLNLYSTSRGKEDLEVTKKILTETMEARAKVAEAFLQGDELIPFIEQLESLEKKTGVEMKLDEPKSGAGKTPNLEISFHLTGPFNSLYRFLSLMENLPYQLEWRAVAWTLDSGTTWSGDFSLAVVSYNQTNASH